MGMLRKVLIDKDRIQARITEMASDIDFYYSRQDWYRHSEEPVIVIGVLTGAIFFMADLVRQLSIRTELDFIRVSTYQGKSITAQEPKITLWPKRNLHDSAHVLLIDDILDTGKTLGFIEDHILWECPLSMKTAVLLRKPGKAKNIETVDFVGFDIPDEFVVGMGLDYNDLYRNLPYVSVLSDN
jgi:hypoxanthine phosphoribosyltransferase